jgi:hypothetical protein
MTNWFELYEVARYGSFSKNETIIIIIVSSIFIAVSWLILTTTKNVILTLISCVMIIMSAIGLYTGIDHSMNPIATKEEFNRKLNSVSPSISKKDLIDTADKLFDFCKNYYSSTNGYFCKDGLLNEYTYNVVFDRIHNNGRTSEDIENAVKYMESRKQNK